MGIIEYLSNKKMKFTAVLLILAIAMAVKTQAQENHLETCMNEAKHIAEHSINTIDGIVSMDIARILQEAAQIATDAQRIKADCDAVKRDDFLMWLDQHSTPAQKVCIQNIMGMLLEIPNLKKALADPSLKWMDKMKAFSPIVHASEQIIEACVPGA